MLEQSPVFQTTNAGVQKIHTFVPTVDFNFSFLSTVEIVIKSRESFPGFVLGHFRFKISCVGTPSPPTPRVARVFGGAHVEMRGRECLLFHPQHPSSP